MKNIPSFSFLRSFLQIAPVSFLLHLHTSWRESHLLRPFLSFLGVVSDWFLLVIPLLQMGYSFSLGNISLSLIYWDFWKCSTQFWFIYIAWVRSSMSVVGYARRYSTWFSEFWGFFWLLGWYAEFSFRWHKSCLARLFLLEGRLIFIQLLAFCCCHQSQCSHLLLCIIDCCVMFL